MLGSGNISQQEMIRIPQSTRPPEDIRRSGTIKFMHEQISTSRLVTIGDAHCGTNLDNPQQVEHEIDQFLCVARGYTKTGTQ